MLGWKWLKNSSSSSREEIRMLDKRQLWNVSGGTGKKSCVCLTILYSLALSNTISCINSTPMLPYQTKISGKFVYLRTNLVLLEALGVHEWVEQNLIPAYTLSVVSLIRFVDILPDACLFTKVHNILWYLVSVKLGTLPPL